MTSRNAGTAIDCAIRLNCAMRVSSALKRPYWNITVQIDSATATSAAAAGRVSSIESSIARFCSDIAIAGSLWMRRESSGRTC